MVLTFPLVFYNDGAAPLIVNNLRLCFLDELDAAPLTFMATYSQFSYDENVRQFATPFPIPGRETLTVICEFQREPSGWEFEVNRYSLALDARVGFKPEWKEITTFPLIITKEQVQTLNRRFLIRDNLIEDET